MAVKVQEMLNKFLSCLLAVSMIPFQGLLSKTEASPNPYSSKWASVIYENQAFEPAETQFFRPSLNVAKTIEILRGESQTQVQSAYHRIDAKKVMALQPLPGEGFIGKYEMQKLEVESEANGGVLIKTVLTLLAREKAVREKTFEGKRVDVETIRQSIAESPLLAKASTESPSIRRIRDWFLNDFSGSIIEFDPEDLDVYGYGRRDLILLAHPISDDPIAQFHEISHAALSAGVITQEEILSEIPEKAIKASGKKIELENPHNTLRLLQLHYLHDEDWALTKKIKSARLEQARRLAKEGKTSEAEALILSMFDTAAWVWKNRRAAPGQDGIETKARLEDLLQLAELYESFINRVAPHTPEKFHGRDWIQVITRQPQLIPALRRWHSLLLEMDPFAMEGFLTTLDEKVSDKSSIKEEDFLWFEDNFSRLMVDISNRVAQGSEHTGRRALIDLMLFSSTLMSDHASSTEVMPFILANKDALLALPPEILSTYISRIYEFHKKPLTHERRHRDDPQNLLAQTDVLNQLTAYGNDQERAETFLNLLSISTWGLKEVVQSKVLTRLEVMPPAQQVEFSRQFLYADEEKRQISDVGGTTALDSIAAMASMVHAHPETAPPLIAIWREGPYWTEQITGDPDRPNLKNGGDALLCFIKAGLTDEFIKLYSVYSDGTKRINLKLEELNALGSLANEDSATLIDLIEILPDHNRKSEVISVLTSPAFAAYLKRMNPDVRKAYLKLARTHTAYSHVDSWIDPKTADVIAHLKSAEAVNAMHTNWQEVKNSFEEEVILKEDRRKQLIEKLDSLSPESQTAFIECVDTRLLDDFEIVQQIDRHLSSPELKTDLFEAYLKNPDFRQYIQSETSQALQFIRKLEDKSVNLAQAYASELAKGQSYYNLNIPSAKFHQFAEDYEPFLLEMPEAVGCYFIRLITEQPQRLGHLPMERLRNLGKMSPVLLAQYLQTSAILLDVLNDERILKTIEQLADEDHNAGIEAPDGVADQYDRITRAVRFNRSSAEMPLTKDWNQRNHDRSHVTTPVPNTIPSGWQVGSMLLTTLRYLPFYDDSRIKVEYEPTVKFLFSQQSVLAKIHPEILKMLPERLDEAHLPFRIDATLLATLTNFSSTHVAVFLLELMDAVRHDDNANRDRVSQEIGGWLKDSETRRRLAIASPKRVSIVTDWYMRQFHDESKPSYLQRLAVVRFLLTLGASDDVVEVLAKALGNSKWGWPTILELIKPETCKSFVDLEKHLSVEGLGSILTWMIEQGKAEGKNKNVQNIIGMIQKKNYRVELEKRIKLLFGPDHSEAFATIATPALLNLLNRPTADFSRSLTLLRKLMDDAEIQTELAKGNFDRVSRWLTLLQGVQSERRQDKLIAQFQTCPGPTKALYLDTLTQWGNSRLDLILSLAPETADSWKENPKILSELSKHYDRIAASGDIGEKNVRQIISRVLQSGRRIYVKDLEVFLDGVDLNEKAITDLTPTAIEFLRQATRSGNKFTANYLASRMRILRAMGDLLQIHNGLKDVAETKRYQNLAAKGLMAILQTPDIAPDRVQNFRLNLLKGLLSQVTGVNKLPKSLEQDRNFLEKVMVFVSLYYSLPNHKETSREEALRMRDFIKEMLTLYLNTGDESVLRDTILAIPENVKEINQLVEAGYDRSLFTKGIEIVQDVQPMGPQQQILEARKTVRNLSQEIAEVAERIGYKPTGIPEEQIPHLRFDTYQAANEFVQQMADAHKGDALLSRAWDVVETIKKIESDTLKEKASKISGTQERIRIVISKDFMEEGSSGLANWAGCFNLHGIHREMPIAHSREANAFMARAYDAQGRMIANVVLALTDGGVVPYATYTSRPDLYLDDAWLEAWKMMAQVSPGVILYDGSAGSIAAALASDQIPELNVQPVPLLVKRATVWGPMYYDFGSPQSDGAMHLQAANARKLTRNIFSDVKIKYRHAEPEVKKVTEKVLPVMSYTTDSNQRIHRLEKVLIQKDLFGMNLDAEIGPLLSALEGILFSDSEDKVHQRLSQLVKRSNNKENVASESLRLLSDRIDYWRELYSDPEKRNQWRIDQGMTVFPSQIDAWRKKSKRTPTFDEVLTLLKDTLVEGMGVDLASEAPKRSSIIRRPARLQLSANEIMRLNFEIERVSQQLATSPKTAERELAEELFGDYLPKGSEVALHGQLRFRDGRLGLELVPLLQQIPYINALEASEQGVLQFELYIRNGELRIEIVDLVSDDSSSSNSLYRGLEALTQHISATVGRPVILEMETDLFKRVGGREEARAADLGWTQVKTAQSRIKELWILTVSPTLEQKNMPTIDLRTEGISFEHSGYYEKTFEPVEDTVEEQVIPFWSLAFQAGVLKEAQNPSAAYSHPGSIFTFKNPRVQAIYDRYIAPYFELALAIAGAYGAYQAYIHSGAVTFVLLAGPLSYFILWAAHRVFSPEKLKGNNSFGVYAMMIDSGIVSSLFALVLAIPVSAPSLGLPIFAWTVWATFDLLAKHINLNWHGSYSRNSVPQALELHRDTQATASAA
jgi:hypothetical protein